MISYNATCYSSGYLYLQIYVDGQQTNPKGSAIFCSQANGSYTYVSATKQAVYTVPTKGTHSVTIAAFQNSGYFGLSNASLVVEK